MVPIYCQHCCPTSRDVAWLQLHRLLSFSSEPKHELVSRLSWCPAVPRSSSNTSLLFSKCFGFVWSPVRDFCLCEEIDRALWTHCCWWQLAIHIIGLLTHHSLSLMFPLVCEQTLFLNLQFNWDLNCLQAAVFTWQTSTTQYLVSTETRSAGAVLVGQTLFGLNTTLEAWSF